MLLKKILLLFLIFTLSCNTNTGNLTIIADLPGSLREASGIETISGSEIIWMLNDGGNSSELFALNSKGKIIKTLKINAKNNDWEDLTVDNKGNIYIADFGNNLNKRNNLAILKVSKDSLNNIGNIEIERISFYYPNQKKFPPKKKKMHFDCEAFFHFNDSLYLFTKSRERNNFGKTNLYKIPARRGNHEAQLMTSFKTCDDNKCWVTSADISSDRKQIAILSPKAVWILSGFTGDDFFSGTTVKHKFSFESQKESVCFKDKNTLLITDEKAHGRGGKMYELKIN